MKPTIYSFPDGYAHGLKKDEFVKTLINDWIKGDSNYCETVWEEYESLGGECEVDEDCVIIDYDLELYNKAEKIVIFKYFYHDTAWQEDYWNDYLSEYEYPYFIGDDVCVKVKTDSITAEELLRNPDDFVIRCKSTNEDFNISDVSEL